MDAGTLSIEWGADQLAWTQLGAVMGPHWHEGGIRWVGVQTVNQHGRSIQVGHVKCRKPLFIRVRSR